MSRAITIGAPAAEGPAEPTDGSLAAYRAKVEEEKDAKKGAGDIAKAKRREERHKRQAEWRRSMKQTQRFLGLRPPRPRRIPMDIGASDLHGLAAFPFESSVVFIAVDVETMETNGDVITEIGLAVLDTEHIRFVPAGLDGRGWMTKIKARHFRVRETMHHVNHHHPDEDVPGCPEKFRFGTSELVSLPEALGRTAECLSSHHHPTVTVTVTEPGTAGLDTVSPRQSHGEIEGRKVVLVGHDVQQDIKFLQNAGFDLTSVPAIRYTVDTGHLWRVYQREFDGDGLPAILADLGLAGWDAHNAGNDAVYALQAMVALAFRDIHPKADVDGERARRIDAAVQDLRDRLWDEAEGWSSDDDDVSRLTPSPKACHPLANMEARGAHDVTRRGGEGSC